MTSYLTFRSNHGPISYLFRDKWRFQSKIANFPITCIFAPPLKRFPLELGTGAWGQKLNWWRYQAEKEVWRYLQPFGYNTRTWQRYRRTKRQTDRRTDTERQQRPILRTASRGNDNKLCGRPPQYVPAPVTLTFNLLTSKVVSESRVTWAISMAILVFLGLSVLDLGPMYAIDVRRQTDIRRERDVRLHHRL